MKQVKGYRWGRKNLLKLAKVASTKAGAYAYRDRRNKKRDFRRLWQIRINAAARQNGLSYSVFIDKLNKGKVGLNRKVLSEIASAHPAVFTKIVEKVTTKSSSWASEASRRIPHLAQNEPREISPLASLGRNDLKASGELGDAGEVPPPSLQPSLSGSLGVFWLGSMKQELGITLNYETICHCERSDSGAKQSRKV